MEDNTTPSSPVDAAPGQERRSAFFNLSCNYSIEPGATNLELKEDALSLLAAGLGAQLADDGNMKDAHWAGFYLIQQAQSIIASLKL